MRMALSVFVLLFVPSHPLSSEVLRVSYLLHERPTESRDCALKEASRF